MLKLTPEQMDKRFDGWVRARFADVRSRGGRHATSRTVRSADRGRSGASGAAGRFGAIAVLERAKAIFPDTRDASPTCTSPAYEATGDLRRVGPDHAGHTCATIDYASNIALAEMLEKLGDLQARAALERVIWISPYDAVAAHAPRRASRRSRRQDRKACASGARSSRSIPWTERSALSTCAALVEAGDRAGARREVLLALEEAPSFERAQALLSAAAATGRRKPVMRHVSLGLIAMMIATTVAAQDIRGGGGRRDRETAAFAGNTPYDGRLTFARIRYNPIFGEGGGGRRDLKWDHDFPRAERNLMKIVKGA